jgi:RecB family exonuclease
MTAPAAQQQEAPTFAWDASTLEFAYSLFRRQRSAPVIEMPKPAIVAPAVDVARRLSPSQLNTFVGDCQLKWFYRSVLKLEDPKDANRALGSAVHAALTRNFRQKIETKQDLPVTEVRDSFVEDLGEELDTAVLTDTDKVEDLQDLGEALVSLYMERVAPTVQPAAVELAVEGSIGGVHVSGYVDLVDTEGRVIDLKTSSKKPSGVRADYRRQVTTYVMLTPNASGAGRLDTMTKTKTVALHQQSYDVLASDRAEVEKLYPLAQEAMRGGLYLPNRGSILCSRKYCSFATRCCEEYGGEVI